MFLAISKYIKPAEEREKHLTEHRAFLDKCIEKNVLVIAGRINPPTGGVILFNVDTEEEARTILREDPFAINKIAEYEIIELVVGKYDPCVSKFIKTK